MVVKVAMEQKARRMGIELRRIVSQTDSRLGAAQITKVERAMTRLGLAIGAAYGFLAVGFGAFAAHGLRASASERALGAVETGAEYALAHAVVLVALGLAGSSLGKWGAAATWAFTAGVALFSGSLFVFGLTEFTGHLWITPIGGLALLAGWALLLASALAKRAGSS